MPIALRLLCFNLKTATIPFYLTQGAMSIELDRVHYPLHTRPILFHGPQVQPLDRWFCGLPKMDGSTSLDVSCQVCVGLFLLWLTLFRTNSGTTMTRNLMIVSLLNTNDTNPLLMLI